jgi:hypothetical protein
LIGRVAGNRLHPRVGVIGAKEIVQVSEMVSETEPVTATVFPADIKIPVKTGRGEERVVELDSAAA